MSDEDRVPWLKEYRWKKGQSGNPKGRPRTKLPSDTRKMLAQAGPDLIARAIYLALGDEKKGLEPRPELLKSFIDKLLPTLAAIQVEQTGDSLPTFVMLDPTQAKRLKDMASPDVIDVTPSDDADGDK